MKKTRKKSLHLVTEEHLDKRIKITEEHLDKRLDRVMKYMDFRFEKVDEFNKELSSFKEHVQKTLDWLVGVFKRWDEEKLAESEQHKRINVKIDDHESRIHVLEKKSAYS